MIMVSEAVPSATDDKAGGANARPLQHTPQRTDFDLHLRISELPPEADCGLIEQ